MSKVQETQEEIIKPYIPEIRPRDYVGKPTPCGDKIMIKAKLSIDEDGNQIAEPGEEIDLFAYVQASKAATDMAQIVARWQAGDETVINVHPNGFEGDCAIIPNSVNDYDSIIRLNDQALANFQKLPDEVKALFDNDASKFFNSVLANKADAIIADYAAKAGQAQEASSKEGE